MVNDREPIDVVSDGPPTPTVAGRFGEAIAIGTSAVPVVGGVIAASLEAVFGIPYRRRTARYLEALGEVVAHLHDHGLTDEDLGSNEAFVSAAYTASRIALGEYLEEKLQWLKAALIHQALPHDIPDLVAERFLTLVGELAPQHVIVLRYACSPEDWYRAKGAPLNQVMIGSRHQTLREAGLGVREAELDVVLDDLDSRRLVTAQMLRGSINGNEVFTP